MGGEGHHLLVVVHRRRLVAELLVRLRDQAEDERIVLVALRELGQRRLVVAAVEGHVADEVGKERRLVGVGARVERGLGRGHVFPGHRLVAPARGQPRLRVLPPELPQVLAGRRDVRLLQPRLVAALVPGLGRRVVAGLEAHAGELVRNLPRHVEVLVLRQVALVEAALVGNGGLAVVLERVRHRH